MKLLCVARVLVRVLLALAGVGLALATLVLSPGGCGRVRGPALAFAADTVVRAAALLRAGAAKPKPAVLPVAVGPGRRAAWRLAKVVRVLDGDTYEVRVGGATLARVRVLEMDAPEHDQPFGAQATDSMRALVLGQYVWVLARGGDRYGRTLAWVKLRPAAFAGGPGRAVDSLAVARGWAWAFDPDHADAARRGQQQAAQAGARGLWKCGTTGPVAPKTWRTMSRAYKARAGVGCSW